MKLLIISTLAALLLAFGAAESELRGGEERRLEETSGGIELKITNIAYQQPFSGFFVMTHNDQARPLFLLGDSPSDELARLAEDGNPGPLVDAYTGQAGVGDVFAFTDGAPYFLGGSFTMSVPVTAEYPYVTIASMAINTNDVFVAINGMKLAPGDIVYSPGYDAGSEENNELCVSVPGPACAEISTENEQSGNGEGFVHVSRGFHGVGGEGPDLSEAGYDWRNSMMQVEVLGEPRVTPTDSSGIDLTITNIAYQQPFSGFFVMTHNKQAEPLFTLGEPPSEELARLAEDGNATALVEAYTGQTGVGAVFAFTEGAPYFLGGSFTIPNVPVNAEFPYVSIAAMAINTNDAFVAVNGMMIRPGEVVYSPGYDAGSEENNELCISVPGPACADISTENEQSGNGEGYVHISRGFHGSPDLSEAGYDWRNPMMQVEASGEGAVRRLEETESTEIILWITNIAYQQPFSGFFVMTHNEQAESLFTLGQPASPELARLAEDGDPFPLVNAYTGQTGVGQVFVFADGAPYSLGGSFTMNVAVSAEYPYLTIASMAINTNDVFVALNGVKPVPGDAIYSVGYDAGTEENNELCVSIPGPACANISTENEQSGNGEGYVHVSRGFHGSTDLSEAGYDWRNPMMQVVVLPPTLEPVDPPTEGAPVEAPVMAPSGPVQGPTQVPVATPTEGEPVEESSAGNGASIIGSLVGMIFVMFL